MKFPTRSAALLLALALSACDKAPTETKPTLHEVMVGVIDPIADVIWENSSKAYGDDGTGKPGKLSDADWMKIQQAARKLHAGAMSIADNPDIVATGPGVKILDEGKVPEAVTAAQVTAYIERDRAGLTSHARELSSLAQRIDSAAGGRDAATTVRLSEELDAVCEACHKRFWYPDQGKPAPAR